MNTQSLNQILNGEHAVEKKVQVEAACRILFFLFSGIVIYIAQ